MTGFAATIAWNREDAVFLDDRFPRRHVWSFDGGATVSASVSPEMLPPPMADPGAVDPEEALTAAAASCHMLWFLSLAARAGVVVDAYRDSPTAVLEAVGGRRMAITRITLRPHARFGGAEQPSGPTVLGLHREAGRRCFIANSLTAEVDCRPVLPGDPAP